MMATPKIEMKPTAAEMLKFVPVSSSAQMPPSDRATTLDRTSKHVEQRVEGQVEQDEDQPQRQRDDEHQAALGLLHLLELAAPFRAVRAAGTGRLVFSWASATAPARSRPRTLNLTAIKRLPCSR